MLVALSFDDQRRALTERLKESGPLDFRRAVYTGGWEMFLERPLTGWGINQMPAELARHVSGYKEKVLYPHNTYLELLVEHGVFGLALYVWLMWEIWRLGRGRFLGPRAEGFLNQQFHAMWPVLLGVYWVNAALVVMNYQFVNGLLFSMAGMLAAQQRRALTNWNLEQVRLCEAFAGPLHRFSFCVDPVLLRYVRPNSPTLNSAVLLLFFCKSGFRVDGCLSREPISCGRRALCGRGNSELRRRGVRVIAGSVRRAGCDAERV